MKKNQCKLRKKMNILFLFTTRTVPVDFLEREMKLNFNLLKI